MMVENIEEKFRRFQSELETNIDRKKNKEKNIQAKFIRDSYWNLFKDCYLNIANI